MLLKISTLALAFLASYCMVSAHEDDISVLKAEMSNLKSALEASKSEITNLKSRLIAVEASNRAQTRRSLPANNPTIVSYCHSDATVLVEPMPTDDDYTSQAVAAAVINLSTVKVDKGDAIKVNFEFTSAALFSRMNVGDAIDDIAADASFFRVQLKPRLNDAKGKRYYPMPDARIELAEVKLFYSTDVTVDDFYIGDLDVSIGLETGYFYFLDLPKGTYSLDLVVEIFVASNGDASKFYYAPSSDNVAFAIGPHVVEIEKVVNMNNECSSKLYYDSKVDDDDKFTSALEALGAGP